MSDQETAAPAQAEPEAAGFWVRGGAVAVDTLVLYAASTAVGLAFTFAGVPRLLNALTGYALGIAYYTWMIAERGQTVGKMAAGVMVVRTDGSAVSLPRAAARYAGSILSTFTLLAGYVMAAFTGQKRALHDYIADTRVVYCEEVGPGRRALMTVLALGLLLAPLALMVLFFVKPLGASLFARSGDNVSLFDKFSNLEQKSKEGATKGGLGSLRAALSIYYGDTEGAYPPSPAGLIAPVPGVPPVTGARYPYLTAIPRVQIKDHPPTDAVEIYGKEVCAAGRSMDVDPAKLRDTGKWGYVADKTAPCWGTLFVDCTHKDSKGVAWYTY